MSKKNDYGKFFEANPTLTTKVHLFSGSEVRPVLKGMLKANPNQPKIRKGLKKCRNASAYSGAELDDRTSQFMDSLDKKGLTENVKKFTPHNKLLNSLIKNGTDKTLKAEYRQGHKMTNWQAHVFADYKAHLYPKHDEWKKLDKIFKQADKTPMDKNKKIYSSAMQDGYLAKLTQHQAVDYDKLRRASQSHQIKLDSPQTVGKKLENIPFEDTEKLAKTNPQKAMDKVYKFNRDYFHGYNGIGFLNNETTHHIVRRDTALDGLKRDISQAELHGTDKDLKFVKNLKSTVKPLKKWIYWNSSNYKKPMNKTIRDINTADVNNMIAGTKRDVCKKFKRYDVLRDAVKSVTNSFPKGLKTRNHQNKSKHLKTKDIQAKHINKTPRRNQHRTGPSIE